jgi:hypothetical protein
MGLSVLQDAHEVRDFVDHAARNRRIAVLDDLVEFSQAESSHRGALALGTADRASDQLEPDRPS